MLHQYIFDLLSIYLIQVLHTQIIVQKFMTVTHYQNKKLYNSVLVQNFRNC